MLGVRRLRADECDEKADDCRQVLVIGSPARQALGAEHFGDCSSDVGSGLSRIRKSFGGSWQFTKTADGAPLMSPQRRASSRTVGLTIPPGWQECRSQTRTTSHQGCRAEHRQYQKDFGDTGGTGETLLPGLGSKFIFVAKIRTSVCHSCGHVRIFGASSAEAPRVPTFVRKTLIVLVVSAMSSPTERSRAW